MSVGKYFYFLVSMITMGSFISGINLATGHLDWLILTLVGVIFMIALLIVLRKNLLWRLTKLKCPNCSSEDFSHTNTFIYCVNCGLEVKEILK